MDWQEHRLSRRLLLTAEVSERIYSLIAEIDAVKNSGDWPIVWCRRSSRVDAERAGYIFWSVQPNEGTGLPMRKCKTL